VLPYDQPTPAAPPQSPQYVFCSDSLLQSVPQISSHLTALSVGDAAFLSFLLKGVSFLAFLIWKLCYHIFGDFATGFSFTFSGYQFTVKVPNSPAETAQSKPQPFAVLQDSLRQNELPPLILCASTKPPTFMHGGVAGCMGVSFLFTP